MGLATYPSKNINKNEAFVASSRVTKPLRSPRVQVRERRAVRQLRPRGREARARQNITAGIDPKAAKGIARFLCSPSKLGSVPGAHEIQRAPGPPDNLADSQEFVHYTRYRRSFRHRCLQRESKSRCSSDKTREAGKYSRDLQNARRLHYFGSSAACLIDGSVSLPSIGFCLWDGAATSSKSRSLERALAKRDMTVPRGQSRRAAIS
jgi:hypothetical protein